MRFANAAFALITYLIALSAIAQPIVAGSLSGQFDVSPVGSPQYSIPLTVPPGTAGMEPRLALSYDTNVTNGPMGPGWAISGLSSITRCAATLDQDGIPGGVGLNTEDRFCLDGQRLVSLGGFNGGNGTEYRTRSESFSKVQSFGSVQGYPTYWIVKTKTGMTLEYGVTQNSRHQSGNEILSWNLNKAIDKNGNYYAVSYHQDTSFGELIPARVDYTGNQNTGLSPNNSIVVTLDIYPGSADSSSHYIGGRRFASNKDISRIEVFAGNVLVSSYLPQYEYSQILNNNRLIGFKRCDASGACLPATRFTWGVDDPTAHLFDPPYNYSFASSVYPDANVAPVVTGDWNGDGKTDLARVYYYGTHVFLSNGVGLVRQPDTEFGYMNSGYSNSYDYPLFSGDFNGDGCTDIGRGSSSGTQVHLSNCNGAFIGGFSHLYGFSPKSDSLIVGDWNGDGKSDIAGHISGTTIRIYLSTGNSFSFMNDFAIHANFSASDSMQTGDFNGDGLSDFSVHYPNSGTYYYVSTGSNFNVCYRGNQFQNSAACFSTAFNGGDGPLYHGDWNGDGVSDTGKVLPSGFNACVLNGNSAIATCRLIPALGLNADSNITSRPVIIGDFNADGLTDVARVQNTGVRIFYARSYYDGTVEFSETTQLPNFGASQGFPNENASPIILGDWNGDGHLDLGRSTNLSHVLSNHKLHQAQRVIRIEEGLGNSYDITYSALTNPQIYTKGTGMTYPNVNLQAAMPVVSSYAVSDGLGGQSVNSFRYVGLSYNITKRSINGFDKVEVHNQNSGITTTTWYRQQNPYEGLPYRKEVMLLSGTVVSRDEDDWDSLSWNQSGQWRYFPYVRESRQYSYEINGTPISSSVTQNIFDSWGNLLTRNLTRSDGSSEVTVSTYDNDATNWLIGQLRSSTVTKIGSGTPAPAALTKRVAFNYLPNTGLLQSEVLEPGHLQLQLIKSYQYDAFGNITHKTVSGIGVQPRTEVTVYDNRGVFPVSVTNALGQTETKTTDVRFGKVTSVTGPNGITTLWQYDSFGRFSSEQRADGTVMTTQYQFPGAGAPTNTALQLRVSATGLPDVVTYSDLLGRQIRKETTGFNGKRILEDKAYNTKGNLTHVSDHYFVGATAAWTVSDYDDLGRVTRVTQPGNRITQTVYNGLSTSVVNPLNQTTTQVVDAQGFVLTSTDAQGQTLSFKNDSYGNPVEIMDPLLNTTFIEYDIQGKKTRLIDPDTGISRFTYNALGELLTETNALNQTTTYSYDLLGRMLQRSSPDGVESWLYDTAVNGIGKLARVTGLNGYLESYQYDSLGRLSRTSTTVGGRSYISSQTYDALGRVDLFVYPSTFTIKNIYNAYGYLSEIRRTDLNSTVWRSNQLNAKGQLELQTFGNGLVTNKIYDTATGYLTAIQTQGAQNLTFSYDALGNLLERQDLRAGLTENFTYDTLNRLLSSTIQGRSPVTVQYDYIGNIISRSDVGTYSYGSGAGPHAVTSISGPKANAYAYDAAGNRVTSNSGSISYSVSGKPVAITKGSNRVEFDLNPADQRIEERVYSNGTLTERKAYVNGLYESSVKGVTTTNTHYIKGSDGLVAILTNTLSTQSTTGSSTPPTPGSRNSLLSKSQIRYVHLDHLGSIQTITDTTGRVMEVLSFDAWGQRRDAFTWDNAPSSIGRLTDRGFTGHEHLDEVSLIHMNGRVYDPEIGRFVSADPFIQTPWNLQSYNRYSYVLNNPLSMTDPSGYFFKKLFKSFKAMLKNPVALTVFVASLSTGFWAAAQVTSFATCTVAGSTIFTSTTQVMVASAAAGGFTGGFTAGILSGNGLDGAFRSGVLGGLTAGVTAGLNSLVDGAFPHYLRTGAPKGGESGSILSEVLSLRRASSQIPRFLARGAIRGSISYVLGGKFDAGFSYSVGADFVDMSYSMLNEYAVRYEYRNPTRLPWATGPDLEGMHSTLNTSCKTPPAFRGTSLPNNAPFDCSTGSANMPLGDPRGELGLVGWIGRNVPTVNGLSLFHDNAMGPAMFNIPSNTTATWWQDAFNIGTIPPSWFYNAAGAGINGSMYDQSLLVNR